MRLLAYGGTSYSIRCRIGDWPSIPEGALGDRSPLLGQSLAFGVGLLKDQQLFLIIRQKQNAEERGGYAFSLLLDPGREVWERFNWNGSYLALSLFGEVGSSGQELLLRPEKFTKSQLGALLEELKPVPIVSQCGQTEDFSALLMSTILLPDPITVSPSVAGFAERPTMGQLASMLQCLPQCFRGGFGWFVGGSGENGLAFGSRLVLYDQSIVEQDSIGKYVESGRKLLSAWNIVAADNESKQLIERRVDVPVWEWEEQFDETPARFFKGIQLLAECLKPSKAEDDVVQEVQEGFHETGEMAEVIRHAARRLALSGSGPLSAFRTVSLLRGSLEHGTSIDRVTVGRLDEQTIIREFVRRRLQPSKVPLELPPTLRVKIWRELIISEHDASKIPNILLDAVNDPYINRDQITELAKKAFENTVKGSGLLSVWSPFRTNQAIGPVIGDWLKDEALSRVRNRDKGSYLDYLNFGQDPGGHHLASLSLPSEVVLGIVEFLLKEAKGSGQFRNDAVKWLRSVVNSPLRKEVPLKKKIEVATTVDESWHALLEIWELHCGRRDEPNESVSIGEVERESLLLELEEMAKQHQTNDPPNLLGIVNLLGTLSQPNIDALSQLRPDLSRRMAVEWVDGWRKVDPATFREEVFRFFFETDQPLPDTFRLSQFGTDELGRLFQELIFGGTENDDDRYRRRFETLFTTGDNEGPFSEAMRSAVKRACAVPLARSSEEKTGGELGISLLDPEARNAFHRRFASQTPVLNLMFERLALEVQDELLFILFERNEERFEEEAYELCRFAQNSEGRITAYQLAILRFLRSPEGATIKNQIGTQMYGLMKAGTIDIWLGKIFPDSTNDEENAIESNKKEHSGSRVRAWPKRAKNFVINRLPKRLRFENSDAESSDAEPPIDEHNDATENNKVSRLSRRDPLSISPPEDHTEHSKKNTRVSGRDSLR